MNGFWTARLKTRASKLSDAVETPSEAVGQTGGLNGFSRDSNPLCCAHLQRLRSLARASVRLSVPRINAQRCGHGIGFLRSEATFHSPPEAVRVADAIVIVACLRVRVCVGWWGGGLVQRWDEGAVGQWCDAGGESGVMGVS